jgi:hypothetical protein
MELLELVHVVTVLTDAGIVGIVAMLLEESLAIDSAASTAENAVSSMTGRIPEAASDTRKLAP